MDIRRGREPSVETHGYRHEVAPRLLALCHIPGRYWNRSYFGRYFPVGFLLAASLCLPESLEEISLTAGQFEILHQGSLDAIKDQDMIVFREKNV
jgi:hypothetical protein